MAEVIEFDFAPGAVTTPGDISLPDGVFLEKLVDVSWYEGSDGTTAAASTDEVPQATAPTASGQSYLSATNKIEIGDTTTALSRLIVRAVPLGGQPVGAATS